MVPTQGSIRPSIQGNPQTLCTRHSAQGPITWFSPPVETVARGVAAEQSPATWSHSHHLTQRLEELSAADENASVETRGCRLQDIIHSTSLTVLSRVRRPHQDLSDGNDAAISNLLSEKKVLYRAYFDRSTDADKAPSANIVALRSSGGEKYRTPG
nr:unnamed protein product [Spirometra erinaceieuropaei]